MKFTLARKPYSSDFEQSGDNQMFKITGFTRKPFSEDFELTIEPTGTTLTLTGHSTFTQNDGRIFVLDGGAADRNFNPSGSFDDYTEVIIINAGATKNITFDSDSSAQVITPGAWAHCFYYDGTWY